MAIKSDYINKGEIEVDNTSKLDFVICNLLNITSISEITTDRQVSMIKDFLKDKKIKPFKNNTGHNYNYNSFIEFESSNISSSGISNASFKIYGSYHKGNSINFRELYIVSDNTITSYEENIKLEEDKLAKLSEDIKQLTEKIENYKDIVEYMKLNNIQNLSLVDFLAHKNLLQHLS